MKNLKNTFAGVLILFFLVLQHSMAQEKKEEKKEKKRVAAVCRDGHKSTSVSGGACSQHNGVKYWIYDDGSTEEENPNLPALIEEEEGEDKGKKKNGKKKNPKLLEEGKGEQEQKELIQRDDRVNWYTESVFFYGMSIIFFQICALLSIIIIYMIKKVFK